MKKLFTTLVLVFATCLSYGQSWKFYRSEFKFGLGASNFLGELGGANQIGTNGIKDFEFSLTRPSFEAAYAYMITPYFKARINGIYGRLKGDDALTKEIYRNNRNLHFRSPIVELSGLIEWYPFSEKIAHLYRLKGASGKKSSLLSPYFVAGIAGFWFNPRAKSPTTGKWVSLKPLCTEGQGLPGGPKPYKTISVSIPMGIGIKYAMNKNWSIGFEITGRMTFTDYIDDVSGTYYNNTDIQNSKGAEAAYFANPTLNLIPPIVDGSIVIDPTGTGMQRGDPRDNDSYMFAIFSLNYRFLRYRHYQPKF